MSNLRPVPADIERAVLAEFAQAIARQPARGRIVRVEDIAPPAPKPQLRLVGSGHP